ncbi:hypothetical protein IEQ34_014586 [Dendrobium chrysotoxum]|uniref:Uncharacterized protein n=1 Tax=Dendrobium chrysotoxum TaxID=161865 RepID=A0AAV7GMJ2_DENCH|nr:hypothetical protein IEQ34_014586 [Dendrobium chrysotoxum]
MIFSVALANLFMNIASNSTNSFTESFDNLAYYLKAIAVKLLTNYLKSRASFPIVFLQIWMTLAYQFLHLIDGYYGLDLLNDYSLQLYSRHKRALRYLEILGLTGDQAWDQRLQFSTSFASLLPSGYHFHHFLIQDRPHTDAIVFAWVVVLIVTIFAIIMLDFLDGMIHGSQSGGTTGSAVLDSAGRSLQPTDYGQSWSSLSLEGMVSCPNVHRVGLIIFFFFRISNQTTIFPWGTLLVSMANGLWNFLFFRLFSFIFFSTRYTRVDKVSGSFLFGGARTSPLLPEGFLQLTSGAIPPLHPF